MIEFRTLSLVQRYGVEMLRPEQGHASNDDR